MFSYDEIYEELLFEFQQRLQRPLEKKEEKLIAFMAECYMKEESNNKFS